MPVAINDTLEGLEALCIERDACDEALAYIADARARGWTVRQFIDNAQAEFPAVYSEWALWCRLELSDALTFATKLAFAKEAMRNDPVVAAHLDVTIATAMTEGLAASEAWSAEELPQIAKELDQGIIQRRWG